MKYLTINRIDEILTKNKFRLDTAYKTIYKYSQDHAAYLFYAKYETREDLKDFVKYECIY